MLNRYVPSLHTNERGEAATASPVIWLDLPALLDGVVRSFFMRALYGVGQNFHLMKRSIPARTTPTGLAVIAIHGP